MTFLAIRLMLLVGLLLIAGAYIKVETPYKVRKQPIVDVCGALGVIMLLASLAMCVIGL